MREEFIKEFPADAPERLRGRVVRAILTDRNLEFLVDMPENPTAEELTYFESFVGDLVDVLPNVFKKS